MEINRRAFLGTLLATSLIPLSFDALAIKNRSILLAPFRSQAGYFLGFLNRSGQLEAKIKLPWRGHGLAISPKIGQAVLFSRRPGRFAVVINLMTHGIQYEFATPANRHFYGHGVFSSDGKYLFATENDFENERGVIGIYDAQKNYIRVGEYPSFGIGPHEIILSRDGKTLIVANGGILTHPDFPRQKLNLYNMSLPSVFLIKRQE